MKLCFLIRFSCSLAGIDDDDSVVEDIVQPSEEDMPVLEGDDDTSRMEEVD